MAIRVISFGGPSVFRKPGIRFCDAPVSHPYGIDGFLCPEFPTCIRNIDDLVFPTHPLRGPRSSGGVGRVTRRKNLKTVAEKKNGKQEDTETEMETGDDFRLSLDVSHFLPEELSVKTKGNKVVVHGRHEEKQDGQGYIEREFTRTYLIPDGVDPETIRSTLSGSGQLCIEAPRSRPPCLEPSQPGKALPIEHVDVEKTEVENSPAQE